MSGKVLYRDPTSTLKVGVNSVTERCTGADAMVQLWRKQYPSVSKDAHLALSIGQLTCRCFALCISGTSLPLFILPVRSMLVSLSILVYLQNLEFVHFHSLDLKHLCFISSLVASALLHNLDLRWSICLCSALLGTFLLQPEYIIRMKRHQMFCDCARIRHIRIVNHYFSESLLNYGAPQVKYVASPSYSRFVYVDYCYYRFCNYDSTMRGWAPCVLGSEEMASLLKSLLFCCTQRANATLGENYLRGRSCIKHCRRLCCSSFRLQGGLSSPLNEDEDTGSLIFRVRVPISYTLMSSHSHFLKVDFTAGTITLIVQLHQDIQELCLLFLPLSGHCPVPGYFFTSLSICRGHS